MGTFNDDPEIGGNQTIWRRIYLAVYDDNLKRMRPSSACFQDGSKGPMSVYIASEAQSAQVVMQDGKENLLAALTVAFVRQLGLGIIRDPSLGGPGHALLLGKKTGAVKEKMAKAATWVAPYIP